MLSLAQLRWVILKCSGWTCSMCLWYCGWKVGCQGPANVQRGIWCFYMIRGSQLFPLPVKISGSQQYSSVFFSSSTTAGCDCQWSASRCFINGQTSEHLLSGLDYYRPGRSVRYLFLKMTGKSVKDIDRYQTVLTSLLASEENKFCADCHAKGKIHIS